MNNTKMNDDGAARAGTNERMTNQFLYLQS